MNYRRFGYPPLRVWFSTPCNAPGLIALGLATHKKLRKDLTQP